MNAREYHALTRKVTHYEWVAEPIDESGDILDPHFAKTETGAIAQVPGLFRQFPDAVSVEIAKVRRYGSDAEGELDREYTYTRRYHRNGQQEAL